MVKGLGRSGDSVTVFPATVASRTDPAEIRAHSPALEYDMHLFTRGEFELHIDCLPTHPVAPDRGVRLAVSLDDGAPMLLDGPSPRYPDDVLTNLRRFITTLAIDRPGRHTLTVWMVDPGVIVDKIVLHTTQAGGVLSRATGVVPRYFAASVSPRMPITRAAMACRRGSRTTCGVTIRPLPGAPRISAGRGRRERKSRSSAFACPSTGGAATRTRRIFLPADHPPSLSPRCGGRWEWRGRAESWP